MQRWIRGYLGFAWCVFLFAPGCNNTAEPYKTEPRIVAPRAKAAIAKEKGKANVRNKQAKSFRVPTP